MNSPVAPEAQGTSTRPYLIRALHDWCTDNGFTPYLAVYVDDDVQVPVEYVKNNEIVLNASFEATSGLNLGNETIEFRARFGGVARDIIVPIDHVIAIYARENGQGMAFPVPTESGDADNDAGTDEEHQGPRAMTNSPGLRLATTTDGDASDENPDTPPPEPPTGSNRPSLKRIK